MLGSIEDIKEYHARVFKDIIPRVPVFFMRYEDLRLDPLTTLTDLFCFLMNKSSINGLNIEKRIVEVVNLGHSASVAYD